MIITYWMINNRLVKWDEILEDFMFMGNPVSGSFSKVYTVTHRQTGTPYALKVISQRKSYMDEFELAHGLEMPNIVKYYQKFEHNETRDIALLLSYEQGGSLDKRLGSALPEDEVKHVAKDILKGLDHIHKNGILHLDIKPENILVSSNKLYKIGDFGKAIRIRSGKQDIFDFDNDDDVEGDSRYMAPELLSSSERVSTKSDMFSFGLTLLEIATKIEIPTNGKAWQDLRDGILPCAYIEQLSPALVDIIKRLLDPEPEKRPEAAELLRHDYFKVKERRLSHPVKPQNCFDTTNFAPLSLPNSHSSYLAHYQVKDTSNRKRKNENQMDDDLFDKKCVAKKLTF